MPTWNPELYLRFSEYRTRANRELVASIRTEHVGNIIDLGCGPGNSTGVLRERWPDAAITGLDNSLEMLNYARMKYPEDEWISGDIPEWASAAGKRFDIVFSGAALQWVGNYQQLFPRLMRRVAIDGTLAVQVPYNRGEPFHRILCDLEGSSFWRAQLPPAGVRAKLGEDAGFYYDILAPVSTKLNIWETRYTLIMSGVESILDWLKGTALRLFLDALSDDEHRKRFVDDFAGALQAAYTPRTNGNVLFPFRRLFLVATN